MTVVTNTVPFLANNAMAEMQHGVERTQICVAVDGATAPVQTEMIQPQV